VRANIYYKWKPLTNINKQKENKLSIAAKTR
jgi:hypothetical protein